MINQEENVPVLTHLSRGVGRETLEALIFLGSGVFLGMRFWLRWSEILAPLDSMETDSCGSRLLGVGGGGRREVKSRC